MISGSDENNKQLVHVTYIKDTQKYTKLYICPKCKYIPLITNNKSYHKDKFEEYIQNYEGKIKRSCLNE
jgi:hypothetical protein